MIDVPSYTSCLNWDVASYIGDKIEMDISRDNILEEYHSYAFKHKDKYIIHEYYFYSEILVIFFSLITWHLTFTPHSYIFKREREVWLFVVVYACIDTHARVFTRDKEETKDTEVYANTCAKRVVMIECSRLVHIYSSFIFFCFF